MKTCNFDQIKLISTKCGKCLKHKRYKGVRKCPWGRYATEITNPKTKRRQWLGTFETIEEAANAYNTAVLSMKHNTGCVNCYAELPVLNNEALITTRPLCQTYMAEEKKASTG